MAKDSDNDKSAAVRQAELHGGETFDPTVASEDMSQPLAPGACPDCKGEGIRDPQATQVCQTCSGTGKA